MSRENLKESPAAASTAASEIKPKSAVLALGAFHDDPVPFAIINRLADFFISHNKKVMFGFEFEKGFELVFNQEVKFLQEYDKYQKGSEEEKGSALKELRKLPPLSGLYQHFQQLKARGIKFPQPYVDAEKNFLRADTEITERVKNRIVTERIGQLMTKEKTKSFSFEDPRLVQMYGHGDETTQRMYKMESDRTDAMAKNILAEIKKESSNPDQRDCVVILTNFGLGHAARVHAKIDKLSKGDVFVASSVVFETERKQEFLDEYDKVNQSFRELEKDLASYYSKFSTRPLPFNLSKQDPANKTDPILKNMYFEIAKPIAEHFGIDAEELKTVDKRAPQEGVPSKQVQGPTQSPLATATADKSHTK